MYIYPLQFEVSVLIINLCGESFILSKKKLINIYINCINLGSFLKTQHDTSNFSLNYVKQILVLFTRVCIFCNFDILNME